MYTSSLNIWSKISKVYLGSCVQLYLLAETPQLPPSNMAIMAVLADAGWRMGVEEGPLPWYITCVQYFEEL
jgi:hypothetical protein